MTDTKNPYLPKTNEALAELSSALARLSLILDDKKKEISSNTQNLKSELSQKDKKIEMMKASYTKIIDNVDSVINRLDKVLEKDGSSNNNN